MPVGAPPGAFPTTPPQQYGFTGGPPPPVGGGPSWNQPPPGSNPQGGKKTPWVPIIVIVGVLILAVGAVGTFLLTRSDSAGSQTVTTSKRTSTEREKPSTTRTTPRTTDSGDPSGFDAQLMALIPAAYPTTVCEKAVPPASGALATVDCRQSTQPGGPAAARYSIFANKDTLDQQFDSSIKEDEELLRCPAADGDSPTTWHYKSTPDTVAGSIACGTYQGNADIVWTQDDDLLLADVQSGNMDDLHNWWLNYS
jgi:serine/threonine-protein kinase